MHRVDADGYTTVGGERRFIDRSLPTYEGTVDGAYWNNAIQEEIVTVIEHAGLTLRASGAADQTAGWDQLKEAIFESEAITGDAITDASVGLAKITSGTAPSLVDSLLPMTNTGGTKSAAYDEEGVQSSITGIGSAYLRGDGILHNVPNLGAAGADTSIIWRDIVIQIDASTWSWSAEGSYYKATPAYNLGKVASSAITNGSYGVYSVSVVGYSSSVSQQIGENVFQKWISFDGSGNATLEKVYTLTNQASSLSGLYCYIRLHRMAV